MTKYDKNKYRVLNDNAEQDFLFHKDSNGNPVIDDLVFEVENQDTGDIYRVVAYTVNPDVEDTIRISFDKLVQNSPLEDSVASEYEEVAYGFYDDSGNIINEEAEEDLEDMMLQNMVVRAIFEHYMEYAREDEYGKPNPHEATLQEVLDKVFPLKIQDNVG